MIQILGLRQWTPRGENKLKIYDAFHDKDWRAESVKDLFDNIDHYLANIPNDEKWNLFYTINNCTIEKRGFLYCHTIAFDIDGGKDKKNGREKGPVDQSQWTRYREVVASVLNCEADKITAVNSGNGLHFIVMTDQPIEDNQFHKKNRHHYSAICKKISVGLKNAALGGEPDTSIFHKRALLRLPNTLNRKPNRDEKLATILSSGPMQSVVIDLETLSGLPYVSPSEQITKNTFAKYPIVDDVAIKTGCKFLQWCKKSPNEVSEPQWYAALSIAGRMKGGFEYAHELSRGYYGYNPDETDIKVNQAISSSGPRTCENIRSLGFTGCSDCEYRDKVISPISIVSKSHIGTENTGFHTIAPQKRPVPNYEDLRRAFERDYQYKCYGDSRIAYRFFDGMYHRTGDATLDEWATKKFNPKAMNKMRAEFRGLIHSTNIRPKEWWVDTTKHFINMANGIYSLTENTLLPHSSNQGFRYILPYAYDASAKAPLFEKFIDEVTCGDKELKEILLEFAGYALFSDSCWAQKCLILVGEGANGKTTFLNILKGLAGEGNYGASSLKDLLNKDYTLSLLDGKLFNVSEELASKSIQDTSLFKDLITGGDVQAREVYKPAYYFRNQTKLIFACNELPAAADASNGFFRRFIIVPFNNTFTSGKSGFDAHIEKKLKLELTGILNLVIERYRKVVERGCFSSSVVSESELVRYKSEIDFEGSWIDENLKVSGDDPLIGDNATLLSRIYEVYSFHARAAGLIPVPKTFLGRHLNRRIPEYRKRVWQKKEEGRNQKYVRGVVLLSETPY